MRDVQISIPWNCFEIRMDNSSKGEEGVVAEPRILPHVSTPTLLSLSPASPLLKMFLFWITIFYLFNPGAGFYHMAMPGGGCTSVTTLRSSVDMVCTYHDRSGQANNNRQSRDPSQPGYDSRATSKEPVCTMTGIHWQRMGVGRTFNISKSRKFGVWYTIPGWGTPSTVHVSLLRVRDIRPEDIGQYQCEIVCAELNKNGQQQTLQKKVNLVLAQPNTHYAIHGIHLQESFCARSFWDGVCQLDCDSEKHLFDGSDCTNRLPHCPSDDFCRLRFANGFCDSECDNPSCGWDGGDCIKTKLKFADDTIVLFLARKHTHINLREVGRSLTALLQTIVRIMPRDWTGPHNTQTEGRKSSSESYPTRVHMETEALYLKLDNTKCKQNCFKRAEKAALFIALAMQKGWDPGISVSAVSVLSRVPANGECALENNTLLDIDLSSVDQGGQYRGQSDGEGFLGLGLQPWVLIAAVASGLALLLLIITLSLVICRMLTKRHKRCRRDSFDLYDSTARIRAEKGPPGTDV